MQTISKERQLYEKLSGCKLSDEEVIEAKQNFVGLFDLLYRIDKRKQEEKRKKRKIKIKNER